MKKAPDGAFFNKDIMIKPTVLLILLFLVSGSLFLSNFPKTVVKYEKSEGYHTFILAAFAGLLLHIVSYVILTVFVKYSPNLAYNFGLEFKSFVAVLMPSIANNAEVLNMVSVSCIAVVLAVLIPMLLVNLYKIFKRDLVLEAWKEDAAGDKTPEFLSLAFRSSELGLPVAFTMKNRKVYIGYIMQTAAAANDIEVLPIVSGYRQKEDLDLKYVIDYYPVMEKARKAEKERVSHNNEELLFAKKFTIVIPHREIVHANLHDMKEKEHFEKCRFDLEQVEADKVNFDTSTTKSSNVKLNKKWFWKLFKRR
ncbi:hypothetical protein CWB99_22865 [Pseudoalteromonas rubra]|uniref:Uncharacterized protein n=1 Tax=Pseudoalteromonas rubra TaxID=43658 RepID=A0A5S3WF78_9GAMM|nr:hypothetical protein [Pseudoalteromonas rubra]TMP23963.1 hypothetical protein CWB99_22865 [Pseudoalteromonas rubra]TMP33351.1 hypothetical protein CWC00_10885 [Pseudoalteromonas rubra]